MCHAVSASTNPTKCRNQPPVLAVCSLHLVQLLVLEFGQLLLPFEVRKPSVRLVPHLPNEVVQIASEDSIQGASNADPPDLIE